MKPLKSKKRPRALFRKNPVHNIGSIVFACTCQTVYGSNGVSGVNAVRNVVKAMFRDSGECTKQHLKEESSVMGQIWKAKLVTLSVSVISQ